MRKPGNGEIRKRETEEARKWRNEEGEIREGKKRKRTREREDDKQRKYREREKYCLD